MINPSFRELSKVTKSRYEMCILVMKRARLLTEGSKPKVRSKGKKPVTVALDEIMSGAVVKAGSGVEPKTREELAAEEEKHKKIVNVENQDGEDQDQDLDQDQEEVEE